MSSLSVRGPLPRLPFKLICACCLGVALPQAAYPAEREQIPLIGSEGPDLDACAGIGRIATLEPDLPVRERPDEHAREKDRLPAATLVWLCDRNGSSAGEDWQGIVYPRGAFQELGDCQVSAPVAAPQPYRGPCRSGWVLARDLRLVLG